MQVYDGADNHDVHYLVAVAPVIKQARAKALGDLYDVHQSSQYGQRVHDDKKTQRVRAADATAVHPEQEEAEAKQSLPDESSQAQNVGACRGGAVDPVG